MIEQDEAIEITQILIQRAKENKHNTPSLICNLAQLSVARSYRHGLKKVIRSFKKTADVIYKDYLKNIKNNADDDGHLMFEYRVMKHCVDYYTIEEINVYNAIVDYVNYIFNGHIIDTILGVERPGGTQDDPEDF